jgi:hypothetical protein
MSGGSKLSNVLKAKEDMMKSPEQLEAEKRDIINNRVVKLDLNGKSKDDLCRIVIRKNCSRFFSLGFLANYGDYLF